MVSRDWELIQSTPAANLLPLHTYTCTTWRSVSGLTENWLPYPSTMLIKLTSTATHSLPQDVSLPLERELDQREKEREKRESVRVRQKCGIESDKRDRDGDREKLNHFKDKLFVLLGHIFCSSVGHVQLKTVSGVGQSVQKNAP